MTGKGASTYYQLAVSRRQLVGGAAFVALLLVMEFAGGVWLGLRHVGTGDRGREGLPAPSLPGAIPLSGPTPVPQTKGAAVAPSSEPSPPLPAVTGPSSPVPAVTPPATPTPSPTPSPTLAPLPPSPSPAARVGAEPSAHAPGWYVQLLATTDEAEAKDLSARLTDAGYPVVTLRSGGTDAPLLRVRVGPYRDRSQAEELAKALGERLGLEPWVTR